MRYLMFQHIYAHTLVCIREALGGKDCCFWCFAVFFRLGGLWVGKP